jgi:hypothetical protein
VTSAGSAPATRADPLDALPPVADTTADSLAAIGALLAQGRPIVLRGAIEHWPALAMGRRSPGALNDYLKRMDRGAAVPVTEAPPASEGRFGYTTDLREFSFSKRQRPLGETLDRIERAIAGPTTSYIAIQMLPLDAQLPDFVRDNPMPLAPAGTAPKLWLGGPVKTQIHNDRDHNLACVVAGHRRFVLFPPEQVGNLYIGPLENPPPLSLVDPEAPDFDRFPRFRDALDHAQVAELTPGDALLMPKYWWHHVTSRDRYNAMVNYWWGEAPAGLGNANDAFLTASLAFGDLPPSERAYWRAMLDSYVFDAERRHADHIPPALQGMLGPMTPALRARLKQRLRAAALKS